MKNILLIPGFLCDTFSSIEKLSIHLTKAIESKYNILWLVPTSDNKYNEFKNNKSNLFCPLYVEELKKNNINYIVGNISKYNILKNMFLFWHIFRKYNIDAVLTQFGFERFYGTFFGKIFGKTTIWYEHWYSLGTKFIFFKKIFYKYFVDNFIAVSSFISSTLPNSKKIYMVHNGIEIKSVNALTEAKRLELKHKFGLSKFDYIVLMIAAFRYEKRYDIAIEIAEKVVNKNKNVGFLFLGDGPLRKKYIEVVKKKNIDEFVIMSGHKLNVEDYLLISDLLMLTSLGEPFGYCLLEAMMYKLPIVAFNLGGPREIIKHKINGYLLPWDNIDGFVDAILDLIKDRKKRHQMGKCGFEKVKQDFDIEMWEKRILSVFDEIFNERGVVG